MTKPDCHNRPDYADIVKVQDGWEQVQVHDIYGHDVDTRAPIMRTIPDPMSKGCQQHSPHGAATMYGWDCAGCRHLPVSRHPCHTTTDDPGPCSWGSPSDPACTGCVKRG